MTQEEKDLLFKDLSSRLPYNPYCLFDDSLRAQLISITTEGDTGVIAYNQVFYGYGCLTPFHIEEIKPYLRPMSSMTEEEKKVYNEISNHLCGEVVAKTMIDFCNKHNLDYRGLIEKGLALEAPEGMYK